jgi:hypothetical protein
VNLGRRRLVLWTARLVPGGGSQPACIGGIFHVVATGLDNVTQEEMLRRRTSARRYGEIFAGKRATLAVVVLLASLAVATMPQSAYAVESHTITFVNNSGETLWIGSTVNADGSHNFDSLPILADGQSASVTIPDSGNPDYWRGKFFARQRCGGESGSTFHCLVGDCGVYADHCIQGEQPASLAEFNFDRNDNLAPWYDVSYVNAVSLSITIAPDGADGSAGAGGCMSASCSRDELLAACPPQDAQYDQQTRILCFNPNRDAETSYSRSLGAYKPRAYLWSTADRVPGNATVFNCGQCPHFVVTFHGGGPAVARSTVVEKRQTVRSVPAVHNFRGYANKCIDVPGGISNDGAQLQLWDCNGTPAQAFTSGPNGSQAALDKCMDVAWAARDNGAKVQLAWCNGGPAQVWVYQGTNLKNPNSGKCVDVRDWNTNNGAPLQIWDCAKNANQIWNLVAPG